MQNFRGWTTFAAVAFFVIAATTSSLTQVFESLVNFDGVNGAGPRYMSLVQGIDGNLYGTTEGGGTGGGVVFKMTPSGQLTPLAVSLNPIAGLVLGTDDNFYGTSYAGGTGDGAIYKVTPKGVVTVLNSFDLYPNGGYPYAPVMQAADGNLYGTTTYGGLDNGSCSFGCGTIFRLTKSGAFTTLYSFNSESDGIPISGLVQGPDGALYGTASGGNTTSQGTVYKISTSGHYKVLHYFCSDPGCTDGDTPIGGLILGNDGNLYGTTENGGSNVNNEPSGTVFRITPDGDLTTIYNFCSQPNCSDGGAPFAGVIQATDGNFYGTGILNSRTEEFGLIYSLTSSGQENPLYDFCSQPGCPDGSAPVGALFQATNGVFYGATNTSGSYGYGNVYSLDMGLNPFVAFIKNVGRVSQSVGILGQGLAGTSSVSLNGTAASFRVVSDTFIKAAVPAGATSGYVRVTTPSGALTSNVPFYVIP